MPRRIRILPDRLVDQIAAGEVVERPASVVKELVENALDAGARRIEVSVRHGGRAEIRVADDGWGMGREDALLALDRHATSKIRELDDLAAIRTMGFRGEALSSIASVSRLVLETAEGEGEGTRILVNGGQIQAAEPCARRTGTTVNVRSLFFNVPARAKFLRSAAVETRAVSEVLTAVALANPEVAFSLESNGAPLFELQPASDLRRRIADVWGEEEAGGLVTVSHLDPGVSLAGMVEQPARASRGRRRTYLFVNGRPFRDRALLRAAQRGYQTTIPSGVHPSLFLFLDVQAGGVDVNVHPTKAEVRFRDGGAVERLVEEGIRRALGSLESAPSLERGTSRNAYASSEYPKPHAGPVQTVRERGPANAPSPSVRAPETHSDTQMALFVPAGEAPLPEAQPPQEPRDAMPRVGMWQVHNTYILAETRSGLIIVDQHAAHERVLYEEIMRAFEGGGYATQRLLFPATLRLSPAEFSMVSELTGVLERAGFEVEPFGDRTIIVHAVPEPHPHFDAERALREMITELTEGSPLIDPVRNQHQRVALTFACKAAIKAGQRLSAEEMEELFDRLFATELPYHDIHGRPTVIQLTLAELHNRFGRHG
jgi:DNA mismatch repair protein MutL